MVYVVNERNFHYPRDLSNTLNQRTLQLYGHLIEIDSSFLEVWKVIQINYECKCNEYAYKPFYAVFHLFTAKELNCSDQKVYVYTPSCLQTYIAHCNALIESRLF